MIRYTASRKWEIVTGIERGELSQAEAMVRHNISAEELAGWQARCAQRRSIQANGRWRKQDRRTAAA